MTDRAEIEGLVSELRRIADCLAHDTYYTDSQTVIRAADALSQTIPRTTDEGMREILAEELQRKGWATEAAALLNGTGDEFAQIALAAMRRLTHPSNTPKTDTGGK